MCFFFVHSWYPPSSSWWTSACMCACTCVCAYVDVCVCLCFCASACVRFGLSNARPRQDDNIVARGVAGPPAGHLHEPGAAEPPVFLRRGAAPRPDVVPCPVWPSALLFSARHCFPLSRLFAKRFHWHRRLPPPNPVGGGGSSS